MKDLKTIFQEIEALVEFIREEKADFDRLKRDKGHYRSFQIFCADLIQLNQEISQLYKKKYQQDLPSGMLRDIFIELLGDQALEQPSRILATLLERPEWFNEDIPLATVYALYTAANSRLALQTNLEHQEQLLRQGLGLQSSVEATKPIAREVARQVQGKQLNSREQRIMVQLSALMQFIEKLPPTLRNYSFSLERGPNNFSTLLTDLLQTATSVDLSSLEEQHDITKQRLQICTVCEEILSQLYLLLNKVLRGHFEGLAQGLKHGSTKALEEKFIELGTLCSELTEDEANMTLFSDKVERYLQAYNNTFTEIENTYHSSDEKSHREEEKLATSQIEAKREAHFIYTLDRDDLSRSSNSYFMEARKRHHAKKIIIPAEKENNFEQVYKDFTRTLGIFPIAPDATASRAALESILVHHLGEENRNKVVRHYNQNTSYVLSNALSSSLSTRDQLLVTQPSKFRQKLYLEQDMVYFDISLESFPIKLFFDEVDYTLWNFKADIKVHAWLSDEGFQVDSISTDNPLVALAYMHNRPEPMLKLMKQVSLIKNRLEEERDKLSQNTALNFFGPLSRLPGLSSITSSLSGAVSSVVSTDTANSEREALIQVALMKIENFQEGRITLDELIQGLEVNNITAGSLPHASYLTGLCNDYIATIPNASFNLLTELVKPLREEMEQIRKEAAPLLRPSTPTPTP